MLRFYRGGCTRAYSSLTPSTGNPLPLDRIVLSGLEFFGFHGVLEQVAPPPFPSHHLESKLHPATQTRCEHDIWLP
jgi:hypothetical protein